MYSDFVFLDRFLFELSCKNTHTHTNTHTHSNEYPIVAFSKNATIKIEKCLDDTLKITKAVNTCCYTQYAEMTGTLYS